ncbi:MAG TPA: GGDEF domain-containing protein, partial [Vicinamibacterales bacterium]|nr:GGDEF domain-containing protein [Vicinamibacterales bacterium]
DTLQASLNEAQEQAGETFALGIADIDNFKTINDTHGHPVGDRVILATAQWLQSSMRDTDFVARYGGEEFALLFAGATAAEAEARLARVLQELASRPFAYDGPDGARSVTFTVSAGIAESSAGDTVDSLVKRADAGLYQARKRGRNRVVVQARSRLASLFR